MNSPFTYRLQVWGVVGSISSMCLYCTSYGYWSMQGIQKQNTELGAQTTTKVNAVTNSRIKLSRASVAMFASSCLPVNAIEQTF